jgi:alpha-galactosidase
LWSVCPPQVGVYNGPGGTSGDSGLSFIEARSHFGAWCIVSSPLILAVDFTNATAVNSVWPIITNTYAIGVNQAYFGSSGNVFSHGADAVTIDIPQSAVPSRSLKYGGKAEAPSVTLPSFQVFAKPLNATSVAVFAVNHASTSTPISVAFAAVPGLNYVAGSSVLVFDVWKQAPAGTAVTSWSTTLASHDSVFLILN